jgi:hypothetical protein
MNDEGVCPLVMTLFAARVGENRDRPRFIATHGKKVITTK